MLGLEFLIRFPSIQKVVQLSSLIHLQNKSTQRRTAAKHFGASKAILSLTHVQDNILPDSYEITVSFNQLALKKVF